MDLREFIVSMTDSLVWPATLLIVFLFLRKSLVKAIDWIRTLRHGDTELAFEQELEKVSRAALEGSITIFRPSPLRVGELSSSFDPFDEGPGYNASVQVDEVASMQWSMKEPRQSVLHFWQIIEDRLEALAFKLGTEPDSVPAYIGAIRSSNALRPSEIEILEGLHRMRNKAAHDIEVQISDKDADRFAMIAQSMTERLEQAVERN